MIFFDVTKSAGAKHASGLMRVNRRLAVELGEAIQPVVWGKWNPAEATSGDWYLTTETFDIDKRPGFQRFLREAPCRKAALFADAIPLKFPQITWPHSVARHPRYMNALRQCDHVFAISSAVAEDLLGFWQWQGEAASTQVSVLPLGADFDSSPRHRQRTEIPPPVLTCVGIVEPRKNQSFLLEVAESLWADGLDFELHIVGRVNPHFGAPIKAAIRKLALRRPNLQFHEAASDEVFGQLLARSRAVVFPTIAEGCGLPVLESLWRALPCVCSNLPVLLENSERGGCVNLPTNDLEAWWSGAWKVLATEAAERPLPTWQASAQIILQQLT